MAGRLDYRSTAAQPEAPALIESADDGPIILFDGVCNLCQNSVRFVLRRDRAGRFRFGSLQSAAGQALLQQHGLQDQGLTSIVLIQDGHAYRKSTAALRIARQLDGLWPALYGFIVVPAFLRDAVYDFIGNRRNRWFGRSQTCWIANETDSRRFID